MSKGNLSQFLEIKRAKSDYLYFKLTHMVTGATSSDVVEDLLAEAARICEGVYHEDGIQVRCAAVWLHAAKLKPLVMKRLGPPVVFATARATGHTSDGGSAGEELSA